jgi:hypothetical protein
VGGWREEEKYVMAAGWLTCAGIEGAGWAAAARCFAIIQQQTEHCTVEFEITLTLMTISDLHTPQEALAPISGRKRAAHNKSETLARRAPAADTFYSSHAPTWNERSFELVVAACAASTRLCCLLPVSAAPRAVEGAAARYGNRGPALGVLCFAFALPHQQHDFTPRRPFRFFSRTHLY